MGHVAMVTRLLKAKEKRIRRQSRQVRRKAKQLVWDLCTDIAGREGVDPFDVLIAAPGTHPDVDRAVLRWMGLTTSPSAHCPLCAAGHYHGRGLRCHG